MTYVYFAMNHMEMLNTLPPVVDNYVLSEILGTGGFSTVYKAKKVSDGSINVVKYFKYNPYGNKGSQNQVIHEVALLKTIKHPNIIQITGYSVCRLSLFIAMEYFEGAITLAQFVKEGLVNDELMLKRIMVQIASALAYIHSMYLFHGDLKTDNVIVTDPPYAQRVKLIDFGNADISGNREREYKTFGSIFNMPREVLTDQMPLDETSDAWALGILMHVLIYGHRPFAGKNPEEFKKLIMKGEPINLTMPPKYLISGEAVDLLRKLFSKVHSNRPVRKLLTNHPFISTPYKPDERNFKKEAIRLMEMAFAHAKEKRYFEAHVNTVEAKTFINIYIAINQKTITNQEFYGMHKKIEEYNDFLEKIQVLSNKVEYDLNRLSYLKAICASSPRVSAILDVGITGEMYYKEGKKDQAVTQLKNAIGEYLKIAKEDIPGERKKLVYNRVQYWMQILSYFTDGGEVPVEP